MRSYAFLKEDERAIAVEAEQGGSWGPQGRHSQVARLLLDRIDEERARSLDLDARLVELAAEFDRRVGVGKADVRVAGVVPDGVTLIADERRRQVEHEQRTFAHDDAHGGAQLAWAAVAYAAPEEVHRVDWKVERGGDGSGPVRGRVFWRDPWPWSAVDDKRARHREQGIRGRIRELVKAGALIAAEIDRLRRGSGGQP